MSASPQFPQLPQQSARRMSEPAWTVRRQTTRPVSVPAPTTAMPKARITRRFEVEWLDASDEVQSDVVVAPALPAFESAFGAFTHGVLITTTDGPVAVEDLVPGMYLEGAGGRVTKLLWKGSITLVPGAPTMSDEPDRLYRVMADALGLGRPVQDQTFGPHARRLDRDPKIRAAMGTEAALVPLSAMADGNSVIEVTPVSPTRVYHLVCERHETILAAGLEVESFHPGPEMPLSLPEELMQVFLNFFPNFDHIRDFGRLATPRLGPEDMAMMS